MKLTHRIRPAAIGIAGAVLLVAVIAAPASAGTKPYAVDITPHTVVAGSTATFTATLSNENGASTTIQLGSANITPPTGFIVTGVSAPTPGGTAAVVNNVVQLRMLGIQPQQSGSVQITTTVPALTGTRAWSIIAKQSNDFNGTGNTLNLDTAHSNLNTTVSAAPSTDLSVTQTDNPDPVVGGADVHYTVTAKNNGPTNVSSVHVDDTATGGGTILSVSGTGWTCTTNSATSVSCNYGALATGATASGLDVVTKAPNPSPTGTITCGSTTAAGIICNTATVSDGIPDNVTSNNTSNEATTVNTFNSGTSASGYVPENLGATVTLPVVTTTGATPQTVGSSAIFPAITSSNSFTFTLTAPAAPQLVCPVNNQVTQCTWEIDMSSTAANGGISADYSDPNKPVEVDIVCGPQTCPSAAGVYLLFKQAGAGQSVTSIFDCSFGGFPCSKPAKSVNGNVVFPTFWLGGDPSVMGKCVAGC